MRILLINPPYVTPTARFGTGHQVPLGLLMVGGALIDAGHEVTLLDAERRHLADARILDHVRSVRPDVVLTGHAGSTPAHPICVRMLRAIKRDQPTVRCVYGGVFPSYHAELILREVPEIDAIVRGEGEATSVHLLQTWQDRSPLDEVAGVTWRDRNGRVVHNVDREPIADLDRHRVGWELIDDWDAYQCFGRGRAVIVQLSRGCPHRCTYCGQHEFWVKWRHRDPLRLVNEIEWLVRARGVRFITLADENPTTSRTIWRTFIQELANRKLPVHFFATIRATDIVRDADFLPLYRAAGILYVLMGIETTSDAVIRSVRKGSSARVDRRACHLLRDAGIFSVLGHIVGLENDTRAALAAARRRLREYDGDYLNAMYVTPHDWTPLGRAAMGNVIEPDQRRWDYRHQVLGGAMKPWQLFLAVKWMELTFHLRVRWIERVLTQRGALARQQWLWVLRHIGAVWVAEIVDFVWTALRRTKPASQTRRRSLPVLPNDLAVTSR